VIVKSHEVAASTTRELNVQQLQDLANGACILGSGGGGSIRMREPLLDVLRQNPVRMARVDEVRDHDWVVVIAVAAAPLLAKEDSIIRNLADAATVAFREMEKATGRTFRFTVAIETGVGNNLFPMVAAARNKAMVVDGAGAFRSVPELGMCRFRDLPIAPVILVSTQGEVLSHAAQNLADAQEFMMSTIRTQHFAGAGAIAFWPMSGDVARGSISAGTVSDTIKLGATVREAAADQKIETVRRELNGSILFTGIIDNVEHQKMGGFDFMNVVLKNDTTEVFRICVQNENLLSWSSLKSAPVAMAPDLICYVAEDGAVFSNADLDSVNGKTIAVIGVPAPLDLRTRGIEEEFLRALAGFGYVGPYIPLAVPR
jgi:DUF917 family protein